MPLFSCTRMISINANSFIMRNFLFLSPIFTYMFKFESNYSNSSLYIPIGVCLYNFLDTEISCNLYAFIYIVELGRLRFK